MNQLQHKQYTGKGGIAVGTALCLDHKNAFARFHHCSGVDGGTHDLAYRHRFSGEGDSCLCIVFSDAMNFSMGSRPSILGDLERHVEQAYGKSIYFKARLRESGERLDTRYITDEELRENIHMDITIED